MSTAAELNGECFLIISLRITALALTHGYDTNGSLILLAEECHSTCLCGFFKAHLLCYYIKCSGDLVVDDLLDFSDLIGSHSLIVREVKSQSVGCNK